MWAIHGVRVECRVYMGLDGIEGTVGGYSGMWAIHRVRWNRGYSWEL